MKADVRQKLLELNKNFYDCFADDFSLTRRPINPGFEGLLRALPKPCPRLLDVACGNGRLGHYFQEQRVIDEYVGVDYSGALLDIATTLVDGTFYERDLSQAGCLHSLGTFTGMACLAALHHIPGRASRVQLLTEMKNHLLPGGRLMLSTWQFTDSVRQRRKIRPWSEIGLSPEEVEAGDYLLTWQRGGFSYRYLHLIDEVEIDALAAAVGLRLIHQYRSDGREGNLSLYSIFGHR